MVGVKESWKVCVGGTRRYVSTEHRADGGVRLSLGAVTQRRKAFGNLHPASFPGQVAKRAAASQPDSVDALERAEKFRQKYWNKLQTLRQQPL